MPHVLVPVGQLQQVSNGNALDLSIVPLSNGNTLLSWKGATYGVWGGYPPPNASTIKFELLAPDLSSLVRDVPVTSNRSTYYTNILESRGLPDGRFLILWQEKPGYLHPDGIGPVYLQIYAADGTAEGEAIVVTTTETDRLIYNLDSDQWADVSLSEQDDGSLLIVTVQQGTSQSPAVDIIVQRIDPTSPDMLVQELYRQQVSFAGDSFPVYGTTVRSASADAVVVQFWYELSGAQRTVTLASDGSFDIAEGSWVPPDPPLAGYDLGNGNTLFVSTEVEPVGTATDVMARIVDASGTEVVAPFRVNSFTDGDQILSDVVVFEDGGFAIVWGYSLASYGGHFSLETGSYDRSLHYIQNYDSAGNALLGPYGMPMADLYLPDSISVDIAPVAGQDYLGWTLVQSTVPDRETGRQSLNEHYLHRYVAFNLIEGTSDVDRTTGTSEADLISGMAGNDWLSAGEGDDYVNAALGNDTLIGGAGNDTLLGGLSILDLRDVIYGGDGNDNADGGYGNDEVNGGNGNDTVNGGFGSDTVVGNDGNDVVGGGAGGDVMFGNAGNDTLNGGFGFDRMNGGAGADSFFHLGVADHGSDWIQDYAAAEGDLLLTGIAGAQRSQFQVNIAFTAGAGSAAVAEAFVIYRPTGQVLFALVDGAGQAEINMQIGGQVYDLLH